MRTEAWRRRKTDEGKEGEVGRRLRSAHEKFLLFFFFFETRRRSYNLGNTTRGRAPPGSRPWQVTGLPKGQERQWSVGQHAFRRWAEGLVGQCAIRDRAEKIRAHETCAAQLPLRHLLRLGRPPRPQTFISCRSSLGAGEGVLEARFARSVQPHPRRFPRQLTESISQSCSTPSKSENMRNPRNLLHFKQVAIAGPNRAAKKPPGKEGLQTKTKRRSFQDEKPGLLAHQNQEV